MKTTARFAAVMFLLAAIALLAEPAKKTPADINKEAGEDLIRAAAMLKPDQPEGARKQALAIYQAVMDNQDVAGWLRVNAISGYVSATTPGDIYSPARADTEIKAIRALYAERTFSEDPLSSEAALRHVLLARLLRVGDYDTALRYADQQVLTASAFWREAAWQAKLTIAKKRGDNATRAEVAYKWLLTPISDPAKAARLFQTEFCPAVRDPAVVSQQQHYDMLNGIYRSYPKTDAAWQPFLGMVRAEMSAYQ